MDNKKEQERAELHKAIWGIADELRGSVDGWDFKQYVLGMLFYRFVSENFVNYVNTLQNVALAAENAEANFDYTNLADEGAHLAVCE